MYKCSSLLKATGSMVLLATLWASAATAFPTYSADPVANTGNCANCHGDFNGDTYTSLRDGTNWGMNLMNGHNSFIDGGFVEQCQTCHTSPGAVPVFTDDSGGPTRVQSCSGCHGRDEDVTPNDGAFGGPGPGRSDGLRAHHASAGVTVCAGCHSADAVQVGEEVEPFNYRPDGGNVLALTDSCADGQFGPDGLDNDGDGATDGADSDCVSNQAPTADPNGPYNAQVGDTITFDGSGSNDPDGTIVSYDWDFGDGTAMGMGANPTHTYGSAGTFTVTLTVTDDGGLTDTATTTATITAQPMPPVSDPNGPYSGQVGDSIAFDGSGSSDPDGSIVSYMWDFGDGTAMGMGATPTHSYGSAGTFTVTLTVTDNDGLTDSASTTATISAQPQPPVSAPNGPYGAQVGESITFDGSGSSDPDGSIVSYDWDFGDGGTGTGVNPSYAYGADGTFTVTLTVTDNDGLTNSASTTATISAQPVPPTADPNGPYSAQVGESITFDGSGSSDPDGSIVSYDWDFGDGGTGTGVNPSYAYSADGTFTVTLTVTDNDGLTNSATTTATISAQPQPPVADPNGPYGAQVGESITFDGSGSSDPDGSIVSYDWDFGDGGTGTGVSPSYAYGAEGSFTVTLTVTDNDGLSNSASTTATISAQPQPPVADPNGPYSGQVGDNIAFDGSGSSDPDGSIVTYDWDFGDGGTGAGVAPMHTYSVDGVFTVTLTVTDNDGLSSSNTTSATITPAVGNIPPTADANGPYNGTERRPVQFSSAGSMDSDGTIVAYLWDFGDGSTSTDANPTHDYLAAATYDVTLTVTDDAGATGSDSTTATIEAMQVNMPPVADPNGPYSGFIGDTITFDGSGSFDPDGTIMRYDWDFGDGGMALDGGAMPTHTYAAAGTYTVTLTVIDDMGETGETGSALTTATIEDRPPGGGEGCTPGYWKQDHHFDSWAAPYTPDTSFGSVFDDAFPGMTLEAVASQGGGGLKALGRQTVAALLNAASPDVSYDLTANEVITAFNDVYPGSKRDYNQLMGALGSFNGQGCPLN